MLKKIFFLNLIFFSNIYTANQTVGSDSSVGSPQSNIEFDGWDNRIATYALMDNGFSMRNNEADLVFDSVFPVSKNVFLRGGEFHLNKDFIFSDNANLSTSAVITGNNRNFVISNNIKDLSSLLSLNYIAKIDVQGDVNGIAWSLSDYGYIAVANTGNKGAIRIYYFDGSDLVYKKDALSNYDSTVVRWKPSGGSFFASNLSHSFFFSNNAYVYLWSYDVANNTIHENSSKSFGNETVDAIAWYTDGTAIAIGRRNDSERITVWEVDANNKFTGTYIKNTANSNVPTTANISNDALDFDSTGQYLAVGFNDTGDSLDELIVYSFNKQSPFSSSTLSYLTGINLNATVSHLDWSPIGSFIAVAVDDGSNYYITCYKHNASTNNLYEIVDARIYSDSKINKLKWSFDGKYLSAGRDSGTGSEFNVYAFNNNKFSLIDEHKIGSNVMGVAFSPDRTYVAQGGTDQSLNIYRFGSEQSYFYFDDTNIILQGDFAIDVPVKFRGNCFIDGNGNKLSLNAQGSILVGSSASLQIENLEIIGIGAQKIHCEDNSAKIFLQNVSLKLYQDWIFDSGAILFSSDVTISGTNSFLYKTNMTSTIDSNSKLTFEYGTEFYYQPSSVDRDLLYMNNSSSYLCLNSASLKSTETGLRLTNGTLLLDNDVTFSAIGSSVSESICLGNGNIENDLDIEVLAAANINLYGSIRYENVE